jgi:D-tyrosyl-tRNA(Tyr) deacylase
VKLVLQRVSHASVRVDDEIVGEIGPGLLVLAGAGEGDDTAEAERMARKTAELRIFSDAEGRFNLSLLETGGEALVVSQFTLYADARRGRRPSFTAAAPPEHAEPVVEAYAASLEALGLRVARGRFGAHMTVELVNDGPVTIILDSADFDRPRRHKPG